MRKVYVTADNIFSPLGKTTGENMQALLQAYRASDGIIPKSIPNPFLRRCFRRMIFLRMMN